MKSNLVVQYLKWLFYIVFIIQAAFLISFAFKWINILPESAFISVVIERYALLITLIGIPGALKLFSVMLKKNKYPNDEVVTTSIYIKAYLARFSILFLVASINIILYGLSLNQNYMLCTLITFTAYIFTYPSASYLRINAPHEDKQLPMEDLPQEQDK